MPLRDSQLHEWYRWFHQHPEPSYAEVETTAKIAGILRNHGVTILDTGLSTGLVAQIQGMRTAVGVESAGTTCRHVVALRGDIDALPIQEQTGLSYASLNPGYLHGCGHDFNLMVALAAALELQEKRDQFAGTVKVIFQPAEEVAATKDTPTGAVAVLRTGVLDDVEAFFGTHDSNALEPGRIGISAGPVSGAVDKFSITITGQGSHAAHPDAGRSPIRPLIALAQGLESLASLDLDPTHPRVVSITHVEAGSTWNVIPDKAFIEGTVRTAYPEDRRILHDRIRSLTSGVADAWSVTADFHWDYGSPAVVNDANWAQVAEQAAREASLEPQSSPVTLGGEDFSYYLDHAPGVFLHIGVGNADRPMHGPTFYPQLDALVPAGRTLSTLALLALRKLRDQDDAALESR
ncbi:amidohydrolase [Bifidobacterium boum]|uniref:amidohydrolase n=1 Tax=Bifidobacterium boum TaxID=78343 RepID=UPI003995CB9C